MVLNTKKPKTNQIVRPLIIVIIYVEVFKTDVIVFIPPLPKGGRGYTVLPLRLFVRPSKIFFLAFFAGSFVGKNLIFGHKRHIGIPYCG